MEVFSIVLGIEFLLEYFLNWVGVIRLESVPSSFHLEILQYFGSHQIMFSICDLGSLVAIIIFCREELRYLPSSLLKVIRSPSSNPEILEKIKRFCVLVMPYAVIYFLFSITHKSLWNLFPSRGFWIWIPSLTSVLVVSSILIICDRKKLSGKTQLDPKEDLTVGLSQLLGFIPGIDRFEAFFGTMRYLGYTCHQAFRYNLLISIPLLLEIILTTTPGIAYPLPLFFWEELNILICLITFICIFAIKFLFLKFADWFWRKFSLTTYSIFGILFGLFYLSHIELIKFGYHFFFIWR